LFFPFSLLPSFTNDFLGVFQNAPLSEIQHFARVCMLDLVQLHGSEPVEWAGWIGSAGVGVIRVFHVPAAGEAAPTTDFPSEVKETKEGIATGKEGSTSTKANGSAVDKEAPPAAAGTLTDPDMREFRRSNYHHHILLDSTRKDGSKLSGGSGVVLDWEWAGKVVRSGEVPFSASPAAGTGAGSGAAGSKAPAHPLPIFLAGGLTPANVAEAVEKVRPCVVDVSGGVEFDASSGKGGKDEDKVKAFIRAAKGIVA
jgi:anthranilate synthase/indole-3-glycerol phosphate synthase/phosphoribosylanthranilate isomerase